MIPGVADLLRASWRLYRSSIALLSGYLAWLLLPQIALIAIPFLPESTGRDTLEFMLVVGSIFLSLWVSLIVVRILSASVTGRHEPLPTVIATSKHRFLPFLWTGLLCCLVTAGGFVLLVIPGILFLVWYAFSTMEAAVGERYGFAALSESRALVRGRFRSVVWRLLAGPVVLTAWYAFGMGLLLLPLLVVTGTPAEALASDNPPMWFLAIDAIGQLFFLTPLLLAYAVLLYHSLIADNPVKGTNNE